MKSICLILGAGASHDCALGAATTVHQPSLQPPLTQGLFSRNFDHFLNDYPKASSLAAELRMLMARHPEKSIETLLRDEKEKPDNPLRQRQLRQIPLYLRVLFSKISDSYLKAEQSCYSMLISQINDHKFDTVLVINLNYDTIFERSLRAMLGIEFNRIGDFVDRKTIWKVLKPHGSVDWIRKINVSRSLVTNKTAYLEYLDDINPEFGHPLKLQDETIIYHSYDNWFKAGEPFYPNMVIPLEGKYEYCCPESHVDVAKEVLKECGNFCIIGSSLKDKDVTDIISSGVTRPINSLVMVGVKLESTLRAELLNRAIKCFKTEPQMNYRGFGHFVQSGDLESFLKTAT